MFKKFLNLLLISISCAFFCITASSLLAQNGPNGRDAWPSLTTFKTDDFSGSGICATCHSNLYTITGEEVSHDAHWRSTMMANAAKDPLWLAKVSSEVVRVEDNPLLPPILEEKCARCHMGMARCQADTNGDDIGILNDGFLNPENPLHEAAMDGVSCTLCHQIQNDYLGDVESFTGQYIIDTSTSPPDRQIFGPYQDPIKTIMENNSGFSPLYSDRMKESKLCSTCHTLYTPTIRADGSLVEDKEFPEQTTYLEWEHSTVNKSCQWCHVPEAFDPSVISNLPKKLEVREHVGQHHFVGGNSFMVELLKNNSSDLGVTAEETHLNDTILRTNTLLNLKTATLNSSASIDQNQHIILDVTIENMAGHKIPTGIPIRRLWLHVTVLDVNNKTVFESGRPRANGSIEGNNTDRDVPPYEPHYNEITESDQVQIYEGVMQNTDGEITQTLLRAYSYAKDNRILPAGFDTQTAHDDYTVWGDAKNDADYVTGGRDEITYKIDISGEEEPFVIITELLYQSLSYPFINDFNEDDVKNEDLVVSFMGQYKKEDKTPVVVATNEVSVP